MTRICNGFLIIVLGLLCYAPYSAASIVVISNKNSNISELSMATIRRIYLSKIKRIPNSPLIPLPIDQSESTAIRADFNRKAIKKSAAQLRSYWAKRIFTGKGGPPKTVSNDKEVLALVESNRNIIGYIDSRYLNDRVKVLLKLG